MLQVEAALVIMASLPWWSLELAALPKATSLARAQALVFDSNSGDVMGWLLSTFTFRLPLAGCSQPY